MEEKAAHLLYFTVKDHPFTDGNKRIGAVLFAWYLRENHLLDDRETGHRRLDNAALAALALLVAESRPAEKEAIIAVIVNLLVRPS